MKSKPTKPRIRWHVSCETAAMLERVRKISGSKSWDDFFVALVAGWDDMPSKATGVVSNMDWEQVLARLDAMELNVMGRFDDRDEVTHAFYGEIQNLTEVLTGVRAFLEIALPPAIDRAVKSQKMPSRNAEILRKFVEGR